MYDFRCTKVEDHGHCATAAFQTADGNSSMTLYIYAGDPVPSEGDLVVVSLLKPAPSLDPVSESVDLGTGEGDAGASLVGTNVEELEPASIGGVDGVATLPVVTDAEVGEERQEPPSAGVVPLGLSVGEKPVDLGDLNVDLVTGEGAALGGSETGLSSEPLSGAASDEEPAEQHDEGQSLG